MNEDKNEERIPIDDLKVSRRTEMVLASMNINYVDQLIEYSASELIKQRNFGKKSLMEIREGLKKLHLCLMGDQSSLELNKLLLMDVPEILKNIKKMILELQLRMNLLHVHLDCAITQSKKPFE